MWRTILLGLLLLPLPSEAAERPVRKTPVGRAIQVGGFGADVAEARKNALRNLADRLEEERGEALDVALLERLGMLEWGAAEPMPELLGRPLLQARLTFTLTRELLESHQSSQREQRARERQWWLGRAIAGLVLVFAVLAGYLQLEEWTRGFATRWLRGLAILILLLGGVLLWWLR